MFKLNKTVNLWSVSLRAFKSFQQGGIKEVMKAHLESAELVLSRKNGLYFSSAATSSRKMCQVPLPSYTDMMLKRNETTTVSILEIMTGVWKLAGLFLFYLCIT